MTLSRLVNTSCIVIGGAIAIYAQAEEKQNTLVLMIGIVMLMFGIYRTARGIPSKYDKSSDTVVKPKSTKDD